MRAAAGEALPAPGPIAQMGSRKIINALFGPGRNARTGGVLAEPGTIRQVIPGPAQGRSPE